MKVKLFFDIDGTLINKTSSWVELLKAFDKREEGDKYYREWLVHQNAHKWAQNDILLYQDKTYEDFMNVLSKYEFFDDVWEWFLVLREHADVYLISGGFGLLVEHIARQLTVPYDHLIYHRIYWEDDAWKVDDNRTFKNKSIIGDYNGYKIAIGNGQNDIDMFKVADMSIGFNIDPKKRDLIVPYIDEEFGSNQFEDLSMFILGIIDGEIFEG